MGVQLLKLIKEVVMNTMKRITLLFSVVVLCVSLGLSQTEVITLIHVNDSHSTLSTIGPRDTHLKGSLGGLARVATVVDWERLTNRNVLLLHAGDLFVGDMFFNKYFGVPELKALKLLGFDAMAVGNHEFDLTPDVLYQSLEAAFPRGGFPLLSANTILDDPAVQPLKKYIMPYVIKQVGSVKVGIFGLTTPAANILSQPKPAVIDIAVDVIAATTVQELKARGCHVVICLSHLGVQVDKQLAQGIPGINVIVGGHDHFLFKKPLEFTNPTGEKTWVVQANAFYLNLGKMTLKVQNGKVQSMQYRMIDIDSGIPEAPLVAATVKFLIKGIEDIYGPVFSKQVAYARGYFEEVATDLNTPGRKDTPIGNLVSDAYRAAGQTEIAIEPGGSTAQPLYQGPLVASDFFRVVGYGFNTDNGLGYRLVKFSMTGLGLQMGLEYGVSDFDNNFDENLIQVSGVKYSYDPNRMPFDRVHSVTVNGSPLDPGRSYTVTANEMLPMIMDYLGIPYADLQLLSGVTEFEALTGYATNLRVLVPKVEGRITCAASGGYAKPFAAGPGVGTDQESGVPVRFELGQNYPNPFNPSTTITYSLPATTHVSLKIFNVIGQEVAQLVSGEQGPGLHQVIWNASGIPSGTYLMRLEAGSDVAIRKLQLLK
jgi:2',3'-cyclic-nucleotide 2'-phosphodiesterase (5'-nucleotidase family)